MVVGKGGLLETVWGKRFVVVVLRQGLMEPRLVLN